MITALRKIIQQDGFRLGAVYVAVLGMLLSVFFLITFVFIATGAFQDRVIEAYRLLWTKNSTITVAVISATSVLVGVTLGFLGWRLSASPAIDIRQQVETLHEVRLRELIAELEIAQDDPELSADRAELKTFEKEGRRILTRTAKMRNSLG